MRLLRLVGVVLVLIALSVSAVSAQGQGLNNFLGTNREDTASKAWWSEGTPIRPEFGNLGPMVNSQRIVAPMLTDPTRYLMHNFFMVSVTGGNVPAQSALAGFIRSTSTHTNPGGKDVTAVSGHTRVEAPSTARGYAGWDSAWNYSREGQAIGRETDVANATGATATTELAPGATTGLAIVGLTNGAGSQYNTFGLLFQSAQGAQSAFRTGIRFDPNAVVPHGEAMRMPNETWISAWNPTDNGRTNILALDGLNQIRIRVPAGKVVMFDNAVGTPLVTINETGRVKALDGVDIGSDWVVRGYPDGVYIERGVQRVKLGP